MGSSSHMLQDDGRHLIQTTMFPRPFEETREQTWYPRFSTELSRCSTPDRWLRMSLQCRRQTAPFKSTQAPTHTHKYMHRQPTHVPTEVSLLTDTRVCTLHIGAHAYTPGLFSRVVTGTRRSESIVTYTRTPCFLCCVFIPLNYSQSQGGGACWEDRDLCPFEVVGSVWCCQ